MPTRRIQLSSRWTGRRRTVWVRVYDTDELMRAGAWRDQIWWGFPSTAPDFENAQAACCFAREWFYNDEREHLVTIHLSREHLDLTSIMHEVVHAAMFLYMVDCTSTYSLSSKHLTGWNETLAHLASDLYSALIWRFDTIPIGN